MILKNKSIHDVVKLYMSLSIEEDSTEIFLNHSKISMTTESTVCVDSQDIMLNNIFPENNLAQYIDGLLLIQSLGYKTDTPYAQFMSAWVLLEKFIQKYFSSLDSEFIVIESKNNFDILNKRTQEYITNTKDKYYKISKFNIGDKFILCCAASKVEINAKTVGYFLKIKNIRDGLHKSIQEKDSFPAEAIFQLLYLFFLRIFAFGKSIF